MLFVSVPNDRKGAGVSPMDDASDELGPVDPLGTPTAKINAFDLAGALATSTKGDDGGKAK